MKETLDGGFSARVSEQDRQAFNEACRRIERRPGEVIRKLMRGFAANTIAVDTLLAENGELRDVIQVGTDLGLAAALRGANILVRTLYAENAALRERLSAMVPETK